MSGEPLPPATQQVTPTKRRRLSAEDRKHELLKAARRAFAKNGDSTATTMKEISREAGVSEAIIYRHFVSKEQLFLEAVVEPLHETVLAAIKGSAHPVRNPLQRVDGTVPFLAALIDDLTEALPLLGLVLFGDPAHSDEFYSSTLGVSADELGDTWSRYYREHGIEFPGRLVAKALIGMAMMMAIEARFNPVGIDARKTAEMLAKLIYNGLFPPRNADGNYVPDWI